MQDSEEGRVAGAAEAKDEEDEATRGREAHVGWLEVAMQHGAAAGQRALVAVEQRLRELQPAQQRAPQRPAPLPRPHLAVGNRAVERYRRQLADEVGAEALEHEKGRPAAVVDALARAVASRPWPMW